VRLVKYSRFFAAKRSCQVDIPAFTLGHLDMQDHHRARLSFVQSGLPWIVGAVAFLLYAATLNHWVTLDSLPFVAKVTGWDWTLPFQTPLFYVVTYPFRWLPGSLQPVALNLFSAICSALTLTLLARSVALLPHDRTHQQRQRERSEFSLLSIQAAWIPVALAALVCGLELTFWEHATAATNESLDLLLFAYVIRCLLEFRVTQDESWLTRMSLVYGLGVTNNFAMIGFFPCVLVAVFWLKGARFFEFRFFVRMLGFGLLGLSLYLVLPLIWAAAHQPSVSFWQALRAHLASQKAMLFDTPQLRTRVVILSLTSILPLLIMAIRWPASFGDTSAAGAALSSIMFQFIHTVFLAACIWVAFDQQFSPRALGFGFPFLTFYYLGALSVGYFSGYLLLVFGENRGGKSWHRRSALQALLSRAVVAAIWIVLLAVPVALIVKNWPSLHTTNGPVLRQLAEQSAKALPPRGAIILSDDPYSLLLLSADLSKENTLSKYMMVHTRSLLSSDYHQQLSRHYPRRWPNFFTNQPPDEVIDDSSLLLLITALSRTNEICYLHPSFGYYFERFYTEPHGLIYQLKSYSTNAIFPPAFSTNELAENRRFWSEVDPQLNTLLARARVDSRDIHYIRQYYSRALNTWGVALQRNQQIEDAGKCFQLAADLNTNNVPALRNYDFNRSLRTGQAHIQETTKSIEDTFGLYRGWEPMLLDNGPFDHPEFCMHLGQIFSQQGLFRQAAIQLDRVRTLAPTNLLASVALANVYLNAKLGNQVLEEIAQLRAKAGSQPLPIEVELELTRLEATAQFGLGNKQKAEAILTEAFAKNPKNPGILDPLIQMYAQTDRLPDAFSTVDKMIQADPDRAQTAISQAGLYLNDKQPAKALEAVDRILKKFPNQPDALLYKVYLLSEAKDYSGATNQIERLLSVEPDNTEALLYKAIVDIQNKSYEAALDPLQKLLKKQPNNATALRNRALAYLRLGDLAKAEKDYNTMRHLAARDYVYVAYWGLGEIAFRRNEPDQIRKYYNLYLQFAPKEESPELKEEKRVVIERLNGLKEAKR
jgi:tetratricopeptide (TPR) repeat protein